ncbi:alpha/beta hydrolase [Sanguibacter sp. 25GB23B1]|uniref:esterase/lipase family protein n=1 Tax=unclassified Sanguibacter TaxID=2645534 RepID=UPI0032AEA4FE
MSPAAATPPGATPPAPSARRTPRLLSWALDYAYVAGLQARSVFGGALRRRPDPTLLATGDGPPVLLLPGVYETWTFLLPVARRLNALGHPVWTVPALGLNRLPVADSARLALDVLAERDLTDVVLVAHSKGGLIGKRMMVQEAEPRRIRGLVAVNTPFGGSRYASYLVGRTLRAFAPGNVDLLDLSAQADANERITSVYAEFDPHIPEQSVLAGATNIELPLAGHFRPLAHPLLVDTVVEAVRRTSAAPPD